MRLLRTCTVVAASALLVAAAADAHAQQAPPAPSEPEEPGLVRVTAQAGGWAVTDLFEHISKATGRSILYQSTNAAVKNSKVEFIGDHVIRDDQLFDWLQSVLAYHKLVLVPVGPIGPDGKQQWFVMDQADPNLRSRPLYIQEKDIFDYENRDGLFVVTTLTLEFIADTARVQRALAPLSTQTAGIGRIQEITGTRALIVSDFAPVVAAMKRLLVFIDKENPQIEPRMEVIALQHAVASELEPIISDLIEASEQARPQQPRQPNMPDEEPAPKIIADNRLDALIVYATDKYMKKIRELIAKLDVPTTARGRLHFRSLRHTDAEEMANLLEDLISQTSDSGVISGSSRTTSPRGTRGAAQPAAGPAGAFAGSGLEGAPVIIPDTKSNSLIIHASPTQFVLIDELIDKLDKSRPQVLIETALVELALSDQLQFGVEVFDTDSDVLVDTDNDGIGDTLTNERAFFGNTGFGLADVVTEDIGGVLVPVNKSPILGTGFTAGIFKNGRLPIVLNAFQSSGRAKILTMPSLVTNDNEQATITLKRTTSFKQTVSDSGQNRTDSFQTVEATTTLDISPHISSDSYLRLDIKQSVSNFGARPSTDAPPDQTQRDIDTHVTLPDTYTVALGGLIQEEERTSVRKVPFLGDIPILGFLFRQTDDQSNPSHLFLFVTPRILRDTEHFADIHRMTWERKLLQDDLFHQEVTFPSRNFHGPMPHESSRERILRLERSGELDAGRLKAPLSAEERRREAEAEWRRMRAGSAEPTSPPVPAPAVPPPSPPPAQQPEKKE